MSLRFVYVLLLPGILCVVTLLLHFIPIYCLDAREGQPCELTMGFPTRVRRRNTVGLFLPGD